MINHRFRLRVRAHLLANDCKLGEKSGLDVPPGQTAKAIRIASGMSQVHMFTKEMPFEFFALQTFLGPMPPTSGLR